MKQFILVTLLSCFMLLAQSATVIEISKSISNEKYEYAQSIINELSPSLEKEFWSAALLISRWNDLRLPADKKEALTIFSDLAKINTDSLDEINQYYIAQSIGQLGLETAQNGSWMDAVGQSFASVNILEDILAKNPGFIDAHTGIAVFRYWVSDKLPLYYWFSFQFSTKDDAITVLENVSRNGKIANFLALQQLFWIYINEEDYDSAEEIVRRYANEIPDSRQILWMNYFVAAYRQNYRESYNNLILLETAYKSIKEKSIINIAEILMKKFEYASFLDEKGSALSIIEEVDKLQLGEFELNYLKGKLNNYMRIKVEYLETINHVSKN